MGLEDEGEQGEKKSSPRELRRGLLIGAGTGAVFVEEEEEEEEEISWRRRLEGWSLSSNESFRDMSTESYLVVVVGSRYTDSGRETSCSWLLVNCGHSFVKSSKGTESLRSGGQG